MPDRAAVYIDGLSVYYGLVHKGWRRLLWIDVGAFARSIAPPGLELVQTKYFTARVPAPPASVKRQATYIEALGAVGGS